MKNYFDFQLTGSKLLSVWLFFMILVVSPYCAILINLSHLTNGESPSPILYAIIPVIILMAFIFSYYITKLVIEGLVYKEKTIEFKGDLGGYLVRLILGVLLNIVTIGIYTPWFIKSIQSYFINNSYYNDEPFNFKGKGSSLFVIMLLSFFLPLIIITLLMITFRTDDMNLLAYQGYTKYEAILFIAYIPYIYYTYKWVFNVDFKKMHIGWETNFWNATGMILGQVLLSIITLGIYAPLAYFKLYEYFTSKTVITSENKKLYLGYDIEPGEDFLFFWGQELLGIITLGFYFPWAICKIYKRVISKTFTEEAKEEV